MGGGDASDFTTVSGALTLLGAGGVTVNSIGGTLALNGTGRPVNLDATNFTVTDAGNTAIDAVVLSLDGTDNTNLTMTANDGSAKTLTISATNAGAGTGNIAITASYAATVSSTAGPVTLDAETDIILDANNANVVLKDDGDIFGQITNNAGELRIQSGITPTTALDFTGANAVFAGTVTSTVGDITATAGNITSTVGNLVANDGVLSVTDDVAANLATFTGGAATDLSLIHI